MTKDEALSQAQSIDSRINIAERVRPMSGGPWVHLLGWAYVTKGGRYSVVFVGVGPDWSSAVADARKRLFADAPERKAGER